MSYTTVIVGTDGSQSSLAAVARAASVATDAAAGLVVVCAYSSLTAGERTLAASTPADPGSSAVSGPAAAQEALRAGTRRARDAGATHVEGRLVEGDAGKVLLAVAQERSGDVIVVGDRGLDPRSGRLLGSVASDVSQRASCDVLIVRTPEGR